MYQRKDVSPLIYLYTAIALAVLWVINIPISYPIRKQLGEHNELFQRAVRNSDSIFFGLMGLGVVAIADNFFTFLRWPLLICFDIIGVFYLLMLIVTVAKALLYKDSLLWLVSCSTLLPVLGGIIMILATWNLLFA